ncbi:major facilitator superfamily MFS_1 [Rhodomicrobium vannielii ATCC 17100]|uniref:Major facilitator superfamily MFS_1 n=1 Tax=Rhodomicrobium vannielii (strain ATCC 17100 / DSM 162 / LMG 4299 / NCIMB 10020 / ATH 3.1.1) TaxID=648757 RepID=E3I8T0_RHOVT|nr:MFS transporter [Rhodomicrobium vannielii]ADP72059.1 major facilitator superfamily MFS_1 [Rhodomicrobium vannielii ATCC 17100]
MSQDSRAQFAAQNRSALDWLSFFLADVKDGVGPFLAIYLTSTLKWDSGSAGLVLTIAGLASVLGRGPAGAFVDAIRWKRALIAIGAGAVALGSVAMAISPGFWTVAIAQVLIGLAEAVLPLTLTAISLGIVGQRGFPRRVGRNEAWSHSGNVVTAILAGAAGYFIAQVAMLWTVAIVSVIAACAVYWIDGRAIDHDLARGEDKPGQAPEALGVLLSNRPLLWFTAAITLFHFANAAMLPLAGQKLSVGQPDESPLFMSSCVVVAQLVMVPMALLVGRKANEWGRKPLFLVAFAVLPLRGLLFALADNPWAIVAIQILDGIGAGIFGALFYIVIADFTRGTGRFNVTQGVAAACWGLGAAMSNAVAGQIVNGFGFSAAFFFLAACALGAFAIFALAVPESLGYEAEGPEAQVLAVT